MHFQTRIHNLAGGCVDLDRRLLVSLVLLVVQPKRA